MKTLSGTKLNSLTFYWL